MKVNFRHNFLFVLLAVTVSQLTHAQGKERGGRTSANASQIYFELGGAGVIYSVNYDGRFGPYENGIGFRVGVGGASVDGDGYVAVPVQLNYLLGAKGNYLELGAGATYMSGAEFFDNSSDYFGTLTIGYRKQPFGKKGFTFRAAFTPLFGFDGSTDFIPFAGISFGVRL